MPGPDQYILTPEPSLSAVLWLLRPSYRNYQHHKVHHVIVISTAPIR